MPAKNNAITTNDICTALDQEFVENFQHEYERLEEVLGLFPAEMAAAGAALYQYKLTGALSSTTPDEGDVTPLSRYKVKKEHVGDTEIKRYAKQTTAEAILKGGFEVSVAKTDKKFVQQLRAAILGGFFEFLGNGAGTAHGVGLQATLARMDATLQDVCETYNDEPGTVVHFVNPYDIADYLGEAKVTTQTVFGMQYLQNFLGVENILVTNRVPKGTAYVTPVENIHVRGIDFGTLGDAGLSYEVGSNGLLGIHHVPDYDRGSADTYAMVGASFLPEVVDFIVKGTIYDNAADVKDATLSALTIGSLALEPAFNPAVSVYTATTTNATNVVTATAADSGATVAIKNGATSVNSGSAATWAAGDNTLSVTVTNGSASKAYVVTVTKE